MTEQVPLPLVIVNVRARVRAATALENVTGLPDPPPVAATREARVEDGASPARASSTVIVWSAFCALTVSVTCGAAL